MLGKQGRSQDLNFGWAIHALGGAVEKWVLTKLGAGMEGMAEGTKNPGWLRCLGF